MQQIGTLALLTLASTTSVFAVCDGNPHNWDRQRRCDEFSSVCPNASWASCEPCDGVGGLSNNDSMSSFTPTSCSVVATPTELKQQGKTPLLPMWPKTFINTGFYEQQIFVKHDPFCLAQIPAMTSKGTHCFKNQQGTFNYDSTQSSLRIDYFKSKSILPHVNMTEHFYHLADGTGKFFLWGLLRNQNAMVMVLYSHPIILFSLSFSVHPEITKYGVVPTPVCPCIALGVGPVSYDWAADAKFVGREVLGIEFLWVNKTVDHWIKGPHHVWTDVATGNLIRLYQPFNGLEVFTPSKYNTTLTQLPAAYFKLPEACVLEEKLGCINGTVV
jgi:hypothetical protein